MQTGAVRAERVVLEKPSRERSRRAIEGCRKEFCERCGGRASGGPHHVRPRSLGGPDVAENLVQLCAECHIAAHSGGIRYTELVALVARREGMDPADVCRRIGWPAPGDVPAPAEPVALSLEEIIQAGISAAQAAEDSRWTMGACAAAAIDGYGLTAGEVASWFGCSASQIRELAKTFRAFPEEHMRDPSLSWRHHRLAAGTSDPASWLARAADEGWSTRQMQERVSLHLGTAEEKDLQRAKAERSLRLAREVMESGGDAAEWLRGRLEELLASARDGR